MSPCRLPAQSPFSAPVWAAVRPCMSISPSWRSSRPASSASSSASATAGDRPCSIRSSPWGPYSTIVHDWVATAPTPARAQGTARPTNGTRVVTATPLWPVAGSMAQIEKVAKNGCSRRTAGGGMAGAVTPGAVISDSAAEARKAGPGARARKVQAASVLRRRLVDGRIGRC